MINSLRFVYRHGKHFIHEHPTLFPIIQRLRGYENEKFCGPNTDLCIEGYQSSANSFVYNVFRILRSDLNIAHHTHSLANVRRALSRGIPTLILFRDPTDAVPSMTARFHPSLEEGLYRYVRFYEFILAESAHLILTSFKEATEQFEDIVRKVEQRTELSFGEFDPCCVRRQTIEHIREWSKQHGEEDLISLPREKREEKKEMLRNRLRKLSEFQDAKIIYHRLLETNTPRRK